uniref:Hint domain-containing protein n=1 Tax=viral metagenome TaxID=1070528 RepID=A0A6M3LL44_9ZZZZ
MRKLATIQRIEKLEPIEGADRIEKATVLGWETVVKLGDFNEGDLCIYIEIDSILPIHEVFDFMANRKYRVKTAKFKKQISCGLVMPLDILKYFKGGEDITLAVGLDVSEILGVRKYDPEAAKEKRMFIHSSRKKRNFILEYMLSYPWFRKLCWNFGYKSVYNFPFFLSKTDEERIQNIPHVFKQYKDTEMYSMEKLDGCLSENTLIETAYGLKTIKEICETKYSDEVLSYNTNKRIFEWNKIIGHSIIQNNNDWYEIELENGKLVTITGDHKVFLSKENRYEKVKNLKDDDIVEFI